MTRLRITLKKSGIGFERNQQATVRSLGLRRLNQTVVREDTPVVRGMLHKVRHMVQVDEVED